MTAISRDQNPTVQSSSTAPEVAPSSTPSEQNLNQSLFDRSASGIQTDMSQFQRERIAQVQESNMPGFIESGQRTVEGTTNVVRESAESLVEDAKSAIKRMGAGIIFNISESDIEVLGNGGIGRLAAQSRTANHFDADALRLDPSLGPVVRVNGVEVPTDPNKCIKIPDFSTARVSRGEDGVIEIAYLTSVPGQNWSVQDVRSIIGRNGKQNASIPSESLSPDQATILQRGIDTN